MIVLKELKGLSVESDIYLADCIVQSGFRVTLGNSGFQPRVEETKTITTFNLI